MKLICECEREFKSKAGLTNHKNRCDGHGTPRDKKRNKQVKPFICPKCEYHIKTSIEKHVNSCNGLGPQRKRKRLPGGQSWAKGRKQTEEHKAKVSNALINKPSPWHNFSEEKKNIIREKSRQDMLERYANGWEAASCGRAKKLDYESPIAGKIKLDGSWELAVAEYLDSIKVVWRRNTTRFEYINLETNFSTYCPDFWVEDWNSYIEVKGYKTDLDACKWSQFTEKLLIWDSEVLKDMNLI